MNLKPRIPKGFSLKAQGCRVVASPARTEATVGSRRRKFSTPTGLRQIEHCRFMERFVSLCAFVVTMNHLEKPRKERHLCSRRRPLALPQAP
jgi:hypothetical protein